MKTQKEVTKENINELVRLTSENPNTRVMCMVSEDCNNGDYNMMSAEFGKPRLEKITFVSGCEISSDEDYIKDQIIYDITSRNKEISDENLDKLVDIEFEKIEWETVITINITE